MEGANWGGGDCTSPIYEMLELTLDTVQSVVNSSYLTLAPRLYGFQMQY